MPNLPKDRCGKCPNCLHLLGAQKIMLAQPVLGYRTGCPQYKQTDVDMWNAACAAPCTGTEETR